MGLPKGEIKGFKQFEKSRPDTALEIRLARLERRERRRRSSGLSSLGPSSRSCSSLGLLVWGSVWSGLGTSVNPYEVQEVEIWSLEPKDNEAPIPVPCCCCGGWGRYEGTDDTLRDPAEILQVSLDEDSLPVPLRRSMVLDEEGWIINDPPPYDDSPSYS